MLGEVYRVPPNPKYPTLLNQNNCSVKNKKETKYKQNHPLCKKDEQVYFHTKWYSKGQDIDIILMVNTNSKDAFFIDITSQDKILLPPLNYYGKTITPEITGRWQKQHTHIDKMVMSDFPPVI